VGQIIVPKAINALLYGQRPRNVVPIGTSVTLGSDGLGGVNLNLTQYSPGASGFPTSGLLLAGPFIKLIRNAGVAGNTSAQILARIYTDALRYLQQGDICVLEIGVNDLPAINANPTSGIQALMANVQACIVACLGAGILPVLLTPLPNNGFPVAAKIVQWYYYDVARSWNIPLFDSYRLAADPATAGNWIAGYSADGTHPQRAGIQALSPTLATFIKNVSSPIPYKAVISEPAAGTTGLEANMLRNGSFAFSAAGMPTGWGAPGGVGSNAVAPAVQPYSGQTYTRTVTSGAQYFLQSDLAQGFTAGQDIFLFSGAMTPNVAAFVGSYQLGLFGVPDNQFGGLQNATQNGLIDFAFPIISQPNWTQIYCNVFSGGDAGTYACNNFTIVNVTKLRGVWSPQNAEIIY